MSEEDWANPVYDAFKSYVNNSNGKELIKNNSLVLKNYQKYNKLKLTPYIRSFI